MPAILLLGGSLISTQIKKNQVYLTIFQREQIQNAAKHFNA